MIIMGINKNNKVRQFDIGSLSKKEAEMMARKRGWTCVSFFIKK